MLRTLRRHMSVANVLSLTALFVALGGVGWAAMTLPRNSVGSAQIKRNAVRSADVQNRSLRAVDFRRGQLPTGRVGATGATGPAGPPGANGANGTNGADGATGPRGPSDARYATGEDDEELGTSEGSPLTLVSL